MVNNSIVNNDLKNIYNKNEELFRAFAGKTVLITGATGLLGSFLVRSFLYADKRDDLNIGIVVLVRSEQKAKEHFENAIQEGKVKLILQDITKPVAYSGKVDYIIHAASNTESQSFVDHPVGTLDVAVTGTKNILELARIKKVDGIAYLSSMEVYGELEVDRGLTKEEDLGYIDILRARSSYQMGKRIAESYCSYYAQEYGVPAKIARLSQIVSSNTSYDDHRVVAHFARCVVEKKDIVLNTPAEVVRSFCYVTDAISAILTILIKGQNGEAYNVANEQAIMRVKDVALKFTEKAPSTNLVFDLKNSEIYPTPTTNWQLSTAKLNALGWSATVSMDIMMNYLISSFYYQWLSLQRGVNAKGTDLKKYKKYLKWIFAVRNKGATKYLVTFGKYTQLIQRAEVYKKRYWDKPLEEKIVVNNFDGNLYGCNPKYLVEEILQRKLPYQIVWLCKNLNKVDATCFPSSVRLADFNKDGLKELSTAKVIISNVRMITLMNKGWLKKPEQYYLQTWHGSLGIKKLDASVENFNTKENETWVYSAHKDSDSIDCMLTNSDFEEAVFRGSFWYKGYLARVGHPRNDVFYKSKHVQSTIREKVCNELNIDKNKKIILYAPTFRDDKRLDVFNLSTEQVLKAFQTYAHKDCVLLIRLHPRLQHFAESFFDFNRENVVNATLYPDIQELLVASDFFISDYSSCMFDFMLSRRPGFIYAEDIAMYDDYRGFYYPLTATPFPVATNNQELIENILHFDMDRYQKEVEVFLRGKGCMEDGHAAERAVDLIEQVIDSNFK